MDNVAVSRSSEAAFLGGLSEDDAAAVLAAGAVRQFAAGQVLFHEGDPADQLILLLCGRVRLWRCSPRGTSLTVHILGEGDLPGCVAAFRRIPFPATATALMPVRAAIWPATALPGLIRRHPVIATNILSIIGARQEELLQRLQELSTECVEQRVARTVLRLAGGDGAPPAQGVELPVRRQDIAEMAGTTLHSVSRLVSRWAREGLVRAGRGRIVVLEPDRFADLAEPAA